MSFALDSRKTPWLFIACAVAVLYGRTVGFDYTHLDDKTLILDNQRFLTDPASFVESFRQSYFHVVDKGHAYYRPFVTASMVLDAQWSGSSPTGYHMTNALLHLAACLLLFALFRRLGFRDGVSLFASLIFAVHPALTEAVAWIPGRNDTLLAVFILSSWILFLRDRAKASWFDRGLHVVFFALALFTKETAVVFPVVLVIETALREDGGWRRLRAAWMWVGWGLAIALLAWARAAVLTETPSRLTAHTVQSFFTNLPVILTSLGKIVLPVNLSVIAITKDTPIWPGIVSSVVLGLLLWRVAGIRWKVVALGALIFVLFVAPGLLVSNMLVLENRLYLPAIGVLIIAAELLERLRVEPRVAWAGGAAILLLVAVAAFDYGDAFRDRRAFSEAAVRGSPHSALARLNLGQVYHQVDKRYEDAEREYRLALLNDPTEPIVHNNLGVLLMAERRWQEAEAELRKELLLNPRYSKAHYNLGIVLRSQERMEEAVQSFRAAIEFDQYNVDAMGELLIYHSRRGDSVSAQRIAEEMERRGVKFTQPPTTSAGILTE